MLGYVRIFCAVTLWPCFGYRKFKSSCGKQGSCEDMFASEQ